ncbi:MAG: PRD domain-containing protein [Clostridiales bacterium]|nr:PRD domain-containing protein [Clostridiales bacterium]
MIVKKILNNNVITSVSEDGQEIIIVGNGIGWKQKAGEPVDGSKIEKIFRMDTATSTARLKQLFLEVNVESIRVSSQIVDYARQYLDVELKKNIYITLTDHIDFAVERCSKGISFQTPLYWEIRTLYAKEFHVGQYALELIQKHMGVTLPEEEAASIALHLVNAEYDGNITHTESTIDIVSTALSIVRLLTGTPFHEDSLDYQRFVTHLLFFAQRVLSGKLLENQGDLLYETMKSTYPKEFQCAEKIAKYVNRQYQAQVGHEEMTFLTVHIVRVVTSSKERSAAEQEDI